MHEPYCNECGVRNTNGEFYCDICIEELQAAQAELNEEYSKEADSSEELETSY